jgi:ribosome-associated heat shock protein Hsp15
MITWRARAHQQCDFVLLLTCRTKRGNPGTRRSPDAKGRLTLMPQTVSLSPWRRCVLAGERFPSGVSRGTPVNPPAPAADRRSFAEDVRLGAADERVSHYSCRVAGDQAGRVDSWIWSVRLARTRSAASAACRAGHVRVNGVRVKPAHAVRAGDEVRLRGEGRDRVVVVQQVITKRVSASVAAACYIDNSPPPPLRQQAVPVAARDRGAGRPTKRERRSIEKLLGRPAR